jgi:hypothetical protein
MVYKSDLKIYEIETIDQYFEIIVESHINGQHSQVTNQIKALSKDQKKDFIDYCQSMADDINPFDAYNKCANKALELI